MGPRKKKIRVGLVFGGQSAEHEVSLQSARNVHDALDRDRYEPVLISIDKNGRWFLNPDPQFLINASNPKNIKLKRKGAEALTLTPGHAAKPDVSQAVPEAGLGQCDVVFPILHGPLGEDGTIQGLFRLFDMPCVGSGVLGSAVAMDKHATKRLLRAAGLPVAPFVTISQAEARAEAWSYERVAANVGPTFFIKPANMGSSVGIHKVKDEASFLPALTDALRYDRKVLCEEAIVGRELEVAVLGNDDPAASVIGEIKPRHEFYSYAAKYLDDKGADLIIPAPLPPGLSREIRGMAVQAFQALDCRGMARVDFFLDRDQRPMINEVNTIPGFTRISMYPKLWGASGLSYGELIDRLITLAMEEHRSVTAAHVASYELPAT